MIRVQWILLLTCLFSFIEAGRAAQGGDGAAKHSGKDKAKPVEKAVESAAATNSGLKNFGQMIPQGSRSRGVRIPAFDGTGKPSSLIVADAMTRIDDTQLFAEKMVIQVFGAKPEEDMRIDLKTGTYNMDAQVLTSEHRSRVSRSDFQIEGDSMAYDTRTGQGKMVGNVEMIIFDADAVKSKMNISQGDAKAAKPDTRQPVPAAQGQGEVPSKAPAAPASAKAKKKKTK